MFVKDHQGEFTDKNVPETLATMVEDAHVNHIPVLTGCVSREDCGDFYGRWFIPELPPDLEIQLISRTIGTTQIVDEMILRFTHTMPMAWMLPGIAATGKRVEIAMVAVVGFRDDKVAHEHIYWDQASVLVQLGLLEATTLPVAGVETARKVVDMASYPTNALITRAAGAG